MADFLDDFGSIIALLTLVAGLVTGLLGYLERRRTQRRTNTIEMLTKIYEDGPIHEAHLLFVDLIASDCDMDADDAATAARVNPLLEYYDFFGSGVERGLFDEELVLIHRGAAMASTWDCVAEYVQERRTILGRPNLYRPFENFVSGIKDPSAY